MVAVNHGDRAELVTRYLRENKLTFKTVLTGRDTRTVAAYGVEAFPTNYLLDAEGKVVWRGPGWDEKRLRDALARMGLK